MIALVGVVSHRLRALQRGVGPLSGKVGTAYAKAVQAGIVQRCRTNLITALFKRYSSGDRFADYGRFQQVFSKCGPKGRAACNL